MLNEFIQKKSSFAPTTPFPLRSSNSNNGSDSLQSTLITQTIITSNTILRNK